MKTFGFLTFSGGIEMEHWAKNRGRVKKHWAKIKAKAPIICNANQLSGFCMMETLTFYGFNYTNFKLKHNF